MLHKVLKRLHTPQGSTPACQVRILQCLSWPSLGWMKAKHLTAALSAQAERHDALPIEQLLRAETLRSALQQAVAHSFKSQP